MKLFARSLLPLAVVLVALTACSSKPQRAPVEDRSVSRRPGSSAPAAAVPAAAASAPAAAESKPLPGAENAGKPGYYTVKPGDTLIRISLEQGQRWRDIWRWNQLEDPNRIEVGQVLRVVAPDVDASAVAASGVATGRFEPRPLDSRAAAAAPAASAASDSASATGVAAPAAAPAPAAASAPAREANDGINWQWPAGGALAGGFEDGRRLGIEIGGKAGDPVLAAADGRVVYAGSGLRGYGNLVIVKHNAVYLTAYAHNQTLLVKEDQAVQRGQKIAEMGSTDAERVQLHFEIRRQGKPVDPLKLLPVR